LVIVIFVQARKAFVVSPRKHDYFAAFRSPSSVGSSSDTVG